MAWSQGRMPPFPGKNGQNTWDFPCFFGWKTWETCGDLHGIFMGFNDLNETSWRFPWDFVMMFDLLEKLGDFTRILRLHGDFSWELSWRT